MPSLTAHFLILADPRLRQQPTKERVNPFLHKMAEATQLTRQGQLHDATQAIQRALGAASAAPSTADNVAFEIPLPNRISLINENDSGTVDRHQPPHPGQEEPEAEFRPIAGTQATEQWISGTFSHRGRTLSYRLYLPPLEPTPSPRPMMVMLHGCTQDASDFASGTQMNAHARGRGIAVLYPEQAINENAQRCWNWFTPHNQKRDSGEPALLAALTLSVIAEHRLDKSRVFVAGLSAGGAMADILGRNYPDIFAAVGVHSGLRTGAATDVMAALSVMRSGEVPPDVTTAHGTGIPTIVFHGDADTTVHPGNGSAIVDAALATHDSKGAGAAPQQTVVGQSSLGQRFSRTTYQDSAGRGKVEYWKLHGAGHAWSGGHPQGSFTNPHGVDASAEMLRFFLAGS